MAKLVSEAIEDVRRHVYGTTRFELNRLAADPGPSATLLTLDFDLQGIVRGNYVSVDDEIMYVLSATPASKQATVIRGFLGTTAAAHAIGSIVEVNARFPRDMIRDALKQEVMNLPPRIFRVTSHSIPVGLTTNGYDFPIDDADFLHVIDVRNTSRSGDVRRPYLQRWQVARGLDTSEYASGVGFYLLENVPSAGNLRVRVAQQFDTSVFIDATDLVADVGLEDRMVDIPVFGAAWRLLSTREIARTNTAAQPEPRRAEEVPPGHITSVVTQLKKLRDDRIAEEAFYLRERYPIRST